jgi:hypothetical protein
VGARRHVELKPIGSMDETVTTWEQGRRVDTENQPSASVPIKEAYSTLTLEPDKNGTWPHSNTVIYPGRPDEPIYWPIDGQDAEGDLHRHAGRHREGRPNEWVSFTFLLAADEKSAASGTAAVVLASLTVPDGKFSLHLGNNFTTLTFSYLPVTNNT